MIDLFDILQATLLNIPHKICFNEFLSKLKYLHFVNILSNNFKLQTQIPNPTQKLVNKKIT